MLEYKNEICQNLYHSRRTNPKGVYEQSSNFPLQEKSPCCLSKVEAITGKKVSPFTIKRLLKGCGQVWKQVRA
ncbi:MAG: hypothetical protein ACK4M7_09850, partial [Burkholderiales bacterium]